MKILFFGLGSIGSRHIRILQKKYSHQLFAFRSKKTSIKNELRVKEIYSWEEVEKINPDIAFITNPTALHLDTAALCAELGIKLFIEKPIRSSSKGLNKLQKIVREKNLVTYVAYNLRFHPVLNELKKYFSEHDFLHLK